MTKESNKTMMTVLKSIVAILLTTVISLLGTMYWDVRDDIEVLNGKVDKLDSLAVQQNSDRKFERLIDSLQTEKLISNFDNLSKQIEDLKK